MLWIVCVRSAKSPIWILTYGLGINGPESVALSTIDCCRSWALREKERERTMQGIPHRVSHLHLVGQTAGSLLVIEMGAKRYNCGCGELQAYRQLHCHSGCHCLPLIICGNSRCRRFRDRRGNFGDALARSYRCSMAGGGVSGFVSLHGGVACCLLIMNHVSCIQRKSKQ